MHLSTRRYIPREHERFIAVTTSDIDDVLSAEAHFDGPCGVYDPASARIAAEAVLSMTKRLIELETLLISSE